MNYFNDCSTEEQAKARFRELAKKFHPDCGGTNEKMIELQKQYEAFNSFSNYNFQDSLKEALKRQNEKFRDFANEKKNATKMWDERFAKAESYAYAKKQRFEDNASLKSEIQTLESQIEHLKKNISEKTSLIDELSNKNDALSLSLRSLQKKEKYLCSRLTVFIKENQKLKDSYPKTLWEYFFTWMKS